MRWHDLPIKKLLYQYYPEFAETNLRTGFWSAQCPRTVDPDTAPVKRKTLTPLYIYTIESVSDCIDHFSKLIINFFSHRRKRGSQRRMRVGDCTTKEEEGGWLYHKGGWEWVTVPQRRMKVGDCTTKEDEGGWLYHKGRWGWVTVPQRTMRVGDCSLNHKGGGGWVTTVCTVRVLLSSLSWWGGQSHLTMPVAVVCVAVVVMITRHTELQARWSTRYDVKRKRKKAEKRKPRNRQ